MRDLLKVIYYILLSIFIFTLGSAIPEEVLGNYADSAGMSAKGTARGNAMTAVVNDWSSVYYNVAGLGRSRDHVPPGKETSGKSSDDMSLKLRKQGDDKDDVKDVKYGSQFAINYLYVHPLLNITIPKYVNGQKNQKFGVITVGLTLDIDMLFELPTFLSSLRFGLSLGVMDDGTLVKINDLEPTYHTFQQYGREAQRTVILAGLGIGILDDFIGIGGGANVLLGGTGKISLIDVVALTSDLQMPLQDVQLDVKTSIAPIAGFYISPGKLWNPLQGLTIGASYRGQVMVDIPLFTAARVDTLGITLNMLIRVLTYFTPHIFTGGISYTLPVAPLTISFDVDYQMWSEHFFNKNMLPVYLENPSFEDIIVLKGGINYKIIREVGISAGYTYQPSYIPDAALYGDINTLDNEKHIFSGGLEFLIPRLWIMKGEVCINIGYQYQMLMKRTVVKIPGLLRSVALNPSYTYGGEVHSAIAEVVFKW